MKTFLSLFLGCALLAAAGCSTVSSRIDQHRAEFASWPPAIQDQVRAGKVDIGFTAEQVRVALGDPVRTFTRRSTEGTAEIWAYQNDRGPRFSFGLGMGSWRGGTGFGSSVVVRDGDWRGDEMMRVVLTNGRVTSIETAGR
jgi:hypothetical protein